ncbi:hypothetical protein [Yeosuana marina]|uniref:hypothetical protein n=1 Tax=Yeosuana marina TaxID=1565536 RepID=UPI001420478B|nr:hypothetical protein [Yeosuana marina]
MNSPTPIDELPSFIEKNYNKEQLVNNPMLKYMIVGGVIMLAIVISATIVGRNQQKTIIIKPEENES